MAALYWLEALCAVLIIGIAATGMVVWHQMAICDSLISIGIERLGHSVFKLSKGHLKSNSCCICCCNLPLILLTWFLMWIPPVKKCVCKTIKQEAGNAFHIAAWRSWTVSIFAVAALIVQSILFTTFKKEMDVDGILTGTFLFMVALSFGIICMIIGTFKGGCCTGDLKRMVWILKGVQNIFFGVFFLFYVSLVIAKSIESGNFSSNKTCFASLVVDVNSSIILTAEYTATHYLPQAFAWIIEGISVCCLVNVQAKWGSSKISGVTTILTIIGLLFGVIPISIYCGVNSIYAYLVAAAVVTHGAFGIIFLLMGNPGG